MSNWIFFALISLIVYIPSFINATGVSTRDKSQYDDAGDKYAKYKQASDREYEASTSDYLKDLIKKIYGPDKEGGDYDDYYKDKYPSYGSDAGGKYTKKDGSDDDGKNKYGSDKYKGGDYKDYKDVYSRYGSDKRDGSDYKNDEKNKGKQTDGYSKYGSDYSYAEILEKLKRLNKDNYDYGYGGYNRYDNDRSRYSNGGKRGSRGSYSSSGSRSGGRRERGSGRGSRSGSRSSRRDRSRNEKDVGYKGYYGDTNDRMNTGQRGDAIYNDDKERHDRSHQWSTKSDRNGGDDSGSKSRSRSKSRGRGSRSGSGSDSRSGSGSRSRDNRDRGDGSDGKDRNGGSGKGKDKDENGACCDRRQVEKMEDSSKCREGCGCCPDGTYVSSIGDRKTFKCGENYLIRGKDRMGEICRADYYEKRSEY